MKTTEIEGVLLWCGIINYALLILWWLILRADHRWIYRFWWTTEDAFSQKKFDEWNFVAMIFYKIAIIMFFFIPYAAMRIVCG